MKHLPMVAVVTNRKVAGGFIWTRRRGKKSGCHQIEWRSPGHVWVQDRGEIYCKIRRRIKDRIKPNHVIGRNSQRIRERQPVTRAGINLHRIRRRRPAYGVALANLAYKGTIGIDLHLLIVGWKDTADCKTVLGMSRNGYHSEKPTGAAVGH